MLEQFFTPYQTATAVSGQRIAILAPHPDDEIFGCGASACKWQQQGREVQAFILTQGVVAGEFANQPNGQQLRQEKIHRRQQESHAAAQVLNLAEPIFLTGQDGELWHDAEIEQLLKQQLQDWQPTTLVIPSIWEMHRDHRATAEMALRLAQSMDSLEQIAMYEIGVPLKANFIEDITDYQATKWQAMQCFASQLTEQDYAEHIRGLNRYRSYTLGLATQYAEAFCVIRKEELSEWTDRHQPEQISLTLRQAEQQSLALRQTVEQLESNNHALNERLSQQQHQAQQSQQTLQAIQNSLSWRLTGPLRWVRANIPFKRK